MLLSQVFIYVKAFMLINSQLGFSKFQFFNGQNGQAGGAAACITVPNFVEIAPTAAEI